jgi:hypothetical protein
MEDPGSYLSLSQKEKALRTGSEEVCFLFRCFRMSVCGIGKIGFGPVSMNVFLSL